MTTDYDTSCDTCGDAGGPGGLPCGRDLSEELHLPAGAVICPGWKGSPSPFVLHPDRFDTWIAAYCLEQIGEAPAKPARELTFADLCEDNPASALDQMIYLLTQESDVIDRADGWDMSAYDISDENGSGYLLCVRRAHDAAGPFIQVADLYTDVWPLEPVFDTIESIIATANRLLPAAWGAAAGLRRAVSPTTA